MPLPTLALLLALLSPPASAQEEPSSPAPATPPPQEKEQEQEEEEELPDRVTLDFDRQWTFTKKENRAIRKVEREVVQGADDRFRQKETDWKVDTYGSARLAAELGVYLDAFEASVLACFDAKRQFSEHPTIKVFASRDEYQKAAPMSGGARLNYEAITEPKGKTRHRIRILDNHLYTYLEETPDPKFTDLDLPAIRGEAAKAVLIGFLGRPNVTIWFENGAAEYFASWDVHAPKKEAYDLRRDRSPGMASIAAHMATARSNWIPPLERLVRLSEHGWESQELSSAVTNSAWAESVVDMLLTGRGVKKSREDLIDDFVKAGLGGTGAAILPDNVVQSLQRKWTRYLDGLYGKAEDE